MSDTSPDAVLPFRHAGLLLRLVAGLVDLGVIWLVAWLVSALMGVPFLAASEEQLAGTNLHAINAIVLFLAWLYFAGLEASTLQATLGMAVLGLYTANLAGDRAGFARTTVRYWARFVSVAVFFLGFLPILFTPRRQGLHDMLAGCIVLKR